MTTRIQLRRDTGANWTSEDPVLASGEIGIETDASPIKFKIGDGVTAWSSLAYFVGSGSPGGSATQVQFNNAGSFDGMPLNYTNPAGEVNLETEASGDDGLDLVLKGKDATANGTGGKVSLIAGNSAGTGFGQPALLKGGDAIDGFGGAVENEGGDSVNSSGGAVNFTGGNSVNGDGGPASLIGGDSTNGVGGDVYAVPGSGGASDGHFRIRDATSSFDAILDTASLSAPRTFAFPNAGGVFALEADVIAALATKQPLDSDLTAIAALTPTNDNIMQRKAGAWVDRTIAQFITDLTAGLSALFAPLAKGVTNGDTHDHVGGDGAQIDHGGLAGLGDDDHTQYVKKSTLEGRYYLPFGVYTTISPITVASSPNYPYAAAIDRTVTFQSFTEGVYVAGTNDGSNYWTIELTRWTDGAVIASVNTSADAGSTHLKKTDTTFAIASAGASDVGLVVKVTATGTPGNLYIVGPMLEVSI
jgi:hypothetical protein